MSIQKALIRANAKFHWVKGYLPRSVRRKLGSAYRLATASASREQESEQTTGSKKVAPSTSVEVVFLEARANADLKPATLFYESFHGSSMNCSPRAIFEALIRSEEHGALEHLWSIKDKALIPEQFRDHPRVSFVKPGTRAYATALATSGILISNSTLPTWYIRRDGQKYVNTWHGVPLKTMFKYESKEHPTVHRNSQRNFLQSTHLLLQNAFTAEALLESASVLEAVKDRVYHIGAPRLDETLTTDREALRAQLGIKPEQKVILIAPTWRGFLGETEVKFPMIDLLLERLGALDPSNYAVFVNFHNFVASKVTNVNKVPAGVSINQFLSVTDTLVSDYSSIVVDFLSTGRQVILFVYDRWQYEELRGLNLQLEDLPVDICYKTTEVVEAVQSGRSAERHSTFQAAKERLFPHEDARATERAIAAFLADDRVHLAKTGTQTRPKILFFGGGLKNNGITTSLLNLLKALSRYDLDIYVVTEGLGIEKSPELLANLRRIDPSIHLIHRAGGMTLEKSANRALERFYANNAFSSPEHAEEVMALFRRESRRLFGDLHFDAAVDFSGYARYWAMLIAATSADHHLIWQHNDLKSEAETRFDVLHGVFATYRFFDRVVSVSDETGEVNRLKLAESYRDGQRPLTVRNTIVPEQILEKAKAPLPEGLTLERPLPVFAMAGRLSAEKAQTRAIRALGLLRRGEIGGAAREAYLVIMGTGVLARELKAEAVEAGVEDLVIFTGHVDNPFPMIAQADCFLLTSDYEGQPMVLLEALTLGKPVISTNIPGSRSVLGDKFGMLTEVSDEGVAKGMAAFLEGADMNSDFDVESYGREAIADFFTATLGHIPPARQG